MLSGHVPWTDDLILLFFGLLSHLYPSFLTRLKRNSFITKGRKSNISSPQKLFPQQQQACQGNGQQKHKNSNLNEDQSYPSSSNQGQSIMFFLIFQLWLIHQCMIKSPGNFATSYSHNNIDVMDIVLRLGWKLLVLFSILLTIEAN